MNKRNESPELLIAGDEIAFQKEEPEKRASELMISAINGNSQGTNEKHYLRTLLSLPEHLTMQPDCWRFTNA